MTRTLTHGINTFLIILIFTGCATVKDLQKSGRLLRKYETYYLNDSLKFSYAFPGDYQLLSEKKVIKKSLRSNNLPINSKYCLAYYKTTTEPELEHYLLYFADTTTANKALKKSGIYHFDNANPFIDTTNCMVAYGVLLDDGKSVVYIIGKSPKKNFHNLRKEYLDIFQTVKIGNDYNNVDITDAFSLAEEYAWDEDSLVNYLLPVKKIRQQEMNYSYDIQQHNQYLQTLGTYQSRITNLEPEQEKTIQEWRTTNNYLDEKLIDNNHLVVTDEKVLDFLIDKCKNEKIVMFNENHFSPNNRMLVILLLKDLYDAGYRHLALEMLWDKNINERGFAVSKSGFYTREPMASNLIREAKRIGFNVFGYDDFSKDREKKQAENIYNNTFKIDPLTKVVVLAGFDHIYEKITTNRKRMAGEFKNTYHIDPLTIDQTEYKTSDNIKLAIIDTVLTPRRRTLQADIYVTNNLNYNTFAHWSHFINYTISILIPDTTIDRINKPTPIDYMINICKKTEYELDSTAVPVYNYAIKKPVTNQINILLPASDYLFFIRSDHNKLIFLGNMDIKEN
jgi:hypothetical protein